MTDLWVQEKRIGAKISMYQKKFNSISARKLPSSAQLGLKTFQLGSTQLRKSQLKLITTSYMLLELAIM